MRGKPVGKTIMRCLELSMLLAVAIGFIQYGPNLEALDEDTVEQDDVGFIPLESAHAELARMGSCIVCHVPRGNVLKRPLWSSATASWGGAQSPYAELRGTLGPPVAGPRQVFPGSDTCLSCHDGLTATAHPDSMQESIPGGYNPGSHPMWMDYQKVRLERPSDYSDISSRSDIRLEDGRVGCLVCHQVHRRSEGRVGIIESACEACHKR
ncbi:MAG: hypothetical protein AABZ44_05205 [Elusimicrobiota bacterium]